ncbi:MAG: shikimate kinase [Clostridia bacterium]|nr:shikimate kinase [Clostridia bacterium]
MARFGLLGKTLGHSYSPAIHAHFGAPDYALFEVAQSDLAAFMRGGDWAGLNVTVPYKKAVVPFLDALSEAARATGAVNTVVRRADGTLYGDNTDVAGLAAAVGRMGLSLSGKKAVVLGSGGGSAAAVFALRQMGADCVVVSRTGADNYGNLERHADASLLVNATPVGMFPHNGEAPVDLAAFPALEGVFDLIYNPARTRLLLDAEARGIPAENGLYMLVAQARRSAEQFHGRAIADGEVERVYALLRRQTLNLVLIGMPGCGKSTAARALSEATGRPVWDADVLFAERFGRSPAEVIRQEGEGAFRARESELLADLGRRSGGVIATGGGAVTRPKNYASLHQNGVILWLQRALDALPDAGRPLSQSRGAAALYAEREPLYRQFADAAYLWREGEPCDPEALLNTAFGE